MANVRNVYQTPEKVSIPKEPFLSNIVYNTSLSKKDLRVLLLLFTQLGGYSAPPSGKGVDPENYKKIDTEVIAGELDMKEKDVKKVIKKLRQSFIIEKGDSTVSQNSYRFTF